MTTCPNRFVTKLAAQELVHLVIVLYIYLNALLLRISYGSSRTVLTQHLHMVPYKVTLQQQLFPPPNLERSRNYFYQVT